MSLVVKLGFKFLDTLILCLKNEIMLFARQRYKIARAIIIFNTIEVVNNPTFGYGAIMSLLPNKNMLCHITPYSCPRMAGVSNLNIPSLILKSPPLPIPAVSSFGVNGVWGILHDSNLSRTTLASFSAGATHLSAITARMLMILIPFSMPLLHIFIVPYKHLGGQI